MNPIDPINILYVHHKPELAGSPMSLFYLMCGLDRQRFRPIVLCPRGPVVDFFRSVAAKVYTAPISAFAHITGSKYHGLRWLILWRELITFPFHVNALRHIIVKERISIVHLNECTLIPAAMLAKLMGVKLVWHIRAVLADGHWGIRRRLVQECMKLANAVVAIDDDVKGCLNDLNKVAVIHNSIDFEELRPTKTGVKIRKEFGISDQELCLGMVGAIHVTKGIFDFIQAAKIVKDHFPRVKFLIIGQDSYPQQFYDSLRGRIVQRFNIRPNYAEQAKSLVQSEGLSQYFVFTGFRSDVADVYSALDIVVFPSHLHGIGRPAFEAAACGKPVIATTTTLNSDIVVDRVTGLLTPQKDPARLSEAMLELLADSKLRLEMGKAGILHARAHFDLRKNAQRMMDLYDSIL